MKRLITFSLIFLVFGCITTLRAATFTAVANGNWSTGSTWDMGSRPNCGSTIIIPAGFTVTVTAIENYTTGCSTPMRIEVYGDLVFDGGKLKLPAGSELYVYPGGRVTEVGPGSGSSSTIEIGGTVMWDADSPPLSGPSSLPDGLLPIELTYFKAKAVGISKTKINWQTASETNNQFFTIERGNDGLSFESVKTIPGAGNSSSIKNYEFTDGSALPGANYYRLKQTDYDGKCSYSGIVYVEHSNKNLGIGVFPNPSDGDVTIVIPEGFSVSDNGLILKVTDITGKVILENKLDYDTHQMNVSILLDKGFYNISVEASDHKATRSTIVH